VVNLICNRFDFYYAAAFLVDEETAPGAPRFARLWAGTGEAGQAMLERGHKLEVGGHSMVGWVCANKSPRIALDVGQDAVRFANPLLPRTRSEIALPLQAGGRVLGALDVQSTQEAAFDESSIAVLQGMADQIAVAVENARLFAQAQASLAQNEQLLSQIQMSLKEATTLYATGQAISVAQDNASIFQAIVDNTVGPEIDVCMLVLFDSSETGAPEQMEISQVWTRSGLPARDLQPGARLGFATFPLRDFLHADHPGVIHSRQGLAGAAGQKMWQDLGMKTVAFVPLNVGARWIGVLGLGMSGGGVFSEESLRPYQAVAGQAATALENRRLFESAQTSLHELSALYGTYTREAWSAALQARPELNQYDYAREDVHREGAGGNGNVVRVPLVVRGQTIGAIEMEGAGRPWTEQERAFVESVTTQAALALDSARLFDQTQRLADRERAINEITARIRAATGVSGILQTAARELATALNVPHAVARIHFTDED
jgi:GAF domain-containing protein